MDELTKYVFYVKIKGKIIELNLYKDINKALLESERTYEHET